MTSLSSVFFSSFFFTKQDLQLVMIVLMDLCNSTGCRLMSKRRNQKWRERGSSFQTRLRLWIISLKELLLVIFLHSHAEASGLHRTNGGRCIIRSCMLTAGEKQEYLLSRGAIYNSKYVHPRQVKG